MSSLLSCPECGGVKLWKDGKRYNDGFAVQKYMCANPECQCRFTPEHNHYKRSRTIQQRQISVILKEAKNLTPKTENKSVSGEKTQLATPLDVKGKLVEFSFYMKKQNFQTETIRTNDGSLKALMDRKANLLDPENVEEVLATACVINKKDGSNVRSWSANRKRNVINAYTLFLKINGLSWGAAKM